MPIFDYRCGSCGREFELIVLRGSQPPECPTCHGTDLEKLISRSAISSAQTRAGARREVRARNQAVRQELAREEHKRFHDHDH